MSEESDHNDTEPVLVEETEEKKFKPDILALVSQHTERPDLFLETLEKHDPGFIKSLNDEIKKIEVQDSEARYKFGKTQAYSGLITQVTAAVISLLGLLGLIYTNQFSFGKIVGLAIFYAVSQGGVTGFKRIVEAIAQAIGKSKPE